MNRELPKDPMSFQTITHPNYPKPKIPLNPVLSLRSFGRFDFQKVPSVLSQGNHIFLTSGRIAIAHALDSLGIGKDDKVLVPAYHCSSMVEPVLWAKATPVFFGINLDTSINLHSIEKQIDKQTKAIIVTHYFGFPQPMNEIRTFCDSHNVAIIEDCAHAFFGTVAGRPIGSFGEYAIASAMKFFPIFDGGCLVSNKRPIKRESIRPGRLPFQLKVIINTLEQSFEYHRLAALNALLKAPLLIKDFLRDRGKKKYHSESVTAIAPGSSEGGFAFDPTWLNTQMSFASEKILTHTNVHRLIQKRRENFQYLHTKLAGLVGTHPLFESLPENVVPYVYPLVYDEPQRYFHSLKQQGIPIIRFGEYLWDGVDERVCKNSIHLSRSVFQFSCHQELTQKELDWMIDTIKRTHEQLQVPQP